MESNDDFLKKTSEKLENCVDHILEQYKSMQVGVANPAILNKVKIDYYGVPTAVSQIAAVSVSEARMLVIVPWDISLLNLIEVAIQKANIGINPSNDGKVIRLVFPQLSEERRKEIVKEVKLVYENFRVQIRNIRNKALKGLDNIARQGEISEDEKRDRENKIQKLIDKYVDKIAGIFEKKEHEVKSL